MKTWNQFKYLAVFLIFFGLVALDHRQSWDWIYTHWIYDYHFGFMKRSLVGAFVSQFFPANGLVPLSFVREISWAIFGVDCAFVLYFFAQIFKTIQPGVEEQKFFLLFAFGLLAPVSLRNYAYDLGRFDHLGILVLFLQWWNIPVLVTAALSALLILIHEGFIFIFLPAILFLVFLKKGLKSAILVGTVSAVTTLLVVKLGKPSVDMPTLWAYLLTKADAPIDHNIELFYRAFGDQLSVNWFDTKKQFPDILGYLLYAYFLLPVASLFITVKQEGLAIWFKRLMIAGYVAIFVLTCDWCRHLANAFLVMLFLLLYFLRNPENRTRVFSNSLFNGRKLQYLAGASLVIPAAGVEVPRVVLVKLYSHVFGLFSKAIRSIIT